MIILGRTFAWPDAYGAFTIGVSQLEDTVRYIHMQEDHHRKMDFDQEFKKILARHGLKEFVSA